MKRYHHKYTLPAIITLLLLAIAFLLIGFLILKDKPLFRRILTRVQLGFSLTKMLTMWICINCRRTVFPSFI